MRVVDISVNPDIRMNEKRATSRPKLGYAGADDADFKAQPFVFDGFGGFGFSWLPIRKAIAGHRAKRSVGAIV